MRLPVQWLHDFTRPELTTEELAHKIEMAGLGVEATEGEGEAAIFTLETTSNRGDWLSIEGLAREISAVTGADLSLASAEVCESEGHITDRASVRIDAPYLCPRYSARLLLGVRVGPSPTWMQERLMQMGLRPINNVVDCTNYVLMEMGQPLHAFDFQKLRAGTVIVRRAREGEELVTIDGVTRRLTEEMLVIADTERAVAVAGVMGGLDTEVTETTTEVLLESAHFSPLSVRRTAKALGMATEASYRFERWVDPAGTVRAASRAAQLIAQTAGGMVVGGVLDEYPLPIEPVEVSVNVPRAAQRLGVSLTPEEVLAFLSRLQLDATLKGQVVECAVPTFRRDLEREADLIEEIARLYGYDNIPVTLPHGVSEAAGLNRKAALRQRLKEALVSSGLCEVVTFSLTNAGSVRRSGMVGETGVLSLRNPLSEDYTQMRTSLLPSALEVLERNARAGATDLHFFELGRVYLPQPGRLLPNEALRVVIGLLGRHWTHTWNLRGGAVQADFYTLKGIIEELLTALRLKGCCFEPTESAGFHPGRTAQLLLHGEPVGVLGQLHPDIAEEYDLPGTAYLAHLDADQLLEAAQSEPEFRALVRFPSLDRDLAVVVDEPIAADEVEAVLRHSGGALLESVELFDVYSGASLPEGKKNLAYSLRFRAEDRTLTDEEADAVVEGMVEELRERVGGELRR